MVGTDFFVLNGFSHLTNEAGYLTKRSELATKYRTRPREENKKAFKKQKNFCNRLYKKERKKYYENLDLRKITDYKKFWNTIKTPFVEKGATSQKISLKEGDKLVNYVRCLAEKRRLQCTRPKHQ